MKKYGKRVIGVMLMALAIVLTQIPMPVLEATSATADFERDGDTLIHYTGTASAVSVPAGIKEIAPEAFADQNGITKVYIPSSVEKIGEGAFRNCTNLKEVYLSDGVSTIESGAFAGCGSLSGFTLPKTLETVGAGVFSGDTALKSVNIGKNPMFSYADGVLYDRDQTKLIEVMPGREAETLNMPTTVTDIERYAFWGQTYLKEVTLSPNLSEIPEYAFSNCTSLQKISIPYSVRRIAAKAFEDCTNLGNVTIPPSVTTIHDTAFDGCDNLKIQAEDGSVAQTFAQEREQNQTVSAMLQDDVAVGNFYNKQDAEQEASAVSGNSTGTGDYDVNHPADVSNLDVSKYYANDPSSVLGKTRIVQNQAVVMMDPKAEENKQETEPVEEKNYELLDDISRDKVKIKQFYQDQSLGLQELPAVTEIGDFAFARSSLQGIILPDGLKKIGYGAFYHCDALTDVEIPSSVSVIEPEAFVKTPYLENWLAGSGDAYLIVGDGVLLAYRGDKSSISIPEGTKKIASGVFSGHTELTWVNLPASLTEIGEAAFSGCTFLEKLTGGDNVQRIKDRAFLGCPLKEINIGAQVKEIGLGAYQNTGAQAAIFAGESLPTLSFEKTATRLDNANLRSMAFDGVETAVIDAYVPTCRDTILDQRYLGFRGLVISPTGASTAQLRYCTLEPNAQKLVEVPATVRAGDTVYTLTGADADAFSAYETFSDWSDGELAGITLPPALGSISDYEPDLFADQTADQTGSTDTQNSTGTTDATGNTQSTDQTGNTAAGTQNTAQDSSEADTSNTVVLDEAVYPNADLIRAEVRDDTEGFRLLVNTDADAQKKLTDAVAAQYGSPVAGQLTTFDLKLVEKKTNIPISSFGKEQVTLKIPISDTLNEQDICVVTLNEDEELELCYGTKSQEGDVSYLTVHTSHFSAYGIYAGIGDVAQMIRQESEALLRKDASPDTGDRFNPKTAGVILLFCIGMLLLLYRRKPIVK
ncbi:leucine-rich repeat domain-containing protein [Kineothrix sp. MSJ-39]|uniref:leucine-rich repeat domain-containing protein n=1 Tax=Kineothrix sp. MSJ-39 TaxID=2841533 RepID=UPI001C0FFE02|nr:leucine-rich repeat domain-containing protein [Kineothrix sp. MSJ-39]MBU5428502.1 leucine-rich repeat domain-containing protein [Kineothrix sp. MSJ-39]